MISSRAGRRMVLRPCCLGDTTLRKNLLATVAIAALLALSGVAQAASLTLATGSAQTISQGGSNSASVSNGATAIVGVTAGTTTGAGQNSGAAQATSQTTPGGTIGTSQHVNTSQTQANNASFAIGLAANQSGSNAGANGNSGAATTGNFFTIVLSPLP